MNVLLDSLLDGESSGRTGLIASEEDTRQDLVTERQVDYMKTFRAATNRIEFDHHLARSTLEAQYTDWYARELRRFVVLLGATQNFLGRTTRQCDELSEARSHLIDSLEGSARETIIVEEADVRHRISDSWRYHESRRAVSADHNFVLNVNALRATEVEVRDQIEASALRKLLMFQRQLASGLQRLATR